MLALYPEEPILIQQRGRRARCLADAVPQPSFDTGLARLMAWPCGAVADCRLISEVQLVADSIFLCRWSFQSGRAHS